jgi:putative ABC transport system substrate-binding protein
MKRRDFIAILGGATMWPQAALTQPSNRRMPHIAMLTSMAENDPELPSRVGAFENALKAQGWLDGEKLRITYRHAAADPSRFRAAAREFVSMAPDLIVVHSNPALVALREVDRTIPTVFVMVGDPVGSGFVDSLARPGGNLTGFTTIETEMGSKWLELLKEAAPGLAEATVLVQPDITANFAYLKAAEVAGHSLGIAVRAARVQDAAAIEQELTALSGRPNSGVVVLPNPVTSNHRHLIAQLSIRNRLPVVTPFRIHATSGSLICYGPDVPDLFRRAAGYVDQILRKESPANLPVQVPAKFQLVINLRSAKAMGLPLPESFLLRADEVIE